MDNTTTVNNANNSSFAEEKAKAEAMALNEIKRIAYEVANRDFNQIDNNEINMENTSGMSRGIISIWPIIIISAALTIAMACLLIIK